MSPGVEVFRRSKYVGNVYMDYLSVSTCHLNASNKHLVHIVLVLARAPVWGQGLIKQ